MSEKQLRREIEIVNRAIRKKNPEQVDTSDITAYVEAFEGMTGTQQYDLCRKMAKDYAEKNKLEWVE